MISKKYYRITKKDCLIESDFWTNRLYKTAYEIVKDRQFPIVIPTYNRPENLFLQWAISTFDKNESWPIYLVVRKSQVKMYKESKYVKDYDYIHVIGFNDDEIDDIGKVRKKIVNYFSKRYSCIFMFDDDITNFTYLVPYKRKTGMLVSQTITNINTARLFAMWQLAMETAISKRADLIISNTIISAFNWTPGLCDEEGSMKFMSGPQNLAVCINLKVFKKYKLNYRTIIGNGHDDIDLLIRAILAGCTVCEFRWLSFCSPGIKTDILNFDNIYDRFAFQFNEMYNNFSDIDFVKFNYGKNGKPNTVGINWSRAIKYHNSLEQAIPLDTRFYNLVKELDL